MNTIIKIKGLKRDFHVGELTVHALRGIDLEIKEGEFCISQACYTKFPRYTRLHEVEKGTQIPIVDVSEMRIYRNLMKAIREYENAEHDA